MDSFKLFCCLLLVLPALGNNLVIAQPDSVAELELMVTDAKTDQEKFDIYFSLADKLYTTEPEKGTDFAFKALHYAKLLGDESATAGAYAVVALNLNYMGYPDSSLPFARKAYNIKRQGKADKYAFSSINTMGIIHDELSNYDSTLHYYYMALEYARKQDNQLNLAAAYNNLGMTLMDKGEMQESYEYYLLALEQFEATGDKKNVAITLNNIATINQQNKEHRKSIQYLIRASEINKELGYHYHLSMNYSNLGISYKALDLPDSALIYYQKSQEIIEQYGFNSDYARNYYNLGNLYFENENFDSARVYFEKSVEISEKQGVKIGLLYNNMRLFDLFIMEDNLEKAQESLQIIEDVMYETGNTIFTDELLHRKSTYYEKSGNTRKALEIYKAYHQYTDSIQDLNYRDNVAELQEKYETEKKTRENQQLRDQNLIQEKTIQNQHLSGIFIAVSLFLVIIIAVILFLSLRKLSKANSELKKLNRKIYAQKQKLQEVNETKDKMFSIIAHDLRSPFNTLIGFLEIMISDFEEMEDDEKKSMLRNLNTQSQKTYGLLENLLQWSMMQRGMIKLNISQHNLHRIVRSQIIDLKSRADSKKIELVNKVSQEMQITADEIMIKTILRNLINNSIKFSFPGGKVTVEAFKTNSTLKICVIDQGMGMSSKQTNHLFNKFIPDSTPGTDNEGGAGLGLRIVKDFVNVLNGEITVKSKPNEGSEFYVVFDKQFAEKECVMLNS